MLVSVVIPTYNRAALLAVTIRSVLAQSYRELEILVVDDGSTDDTRAVVEGFGDRVRYIHQPNQERAAARNHGFRLSKGALVCFLDSDDLWEPDHIEQLVPLFHGQKELALVCTDYFLIDANGRRMRTIRAHGASGDVFQALLRRNFICTSSAMVRRSALDPAKPFQEDRDLSGSEDWELWLRLAAKHPFRHLAKPTLSFRTHDSATMGNPDALARSCMRALDRIFENGDLRSRLATVDREKIYAAQFRILANAYFAAGQMERSRTMLREATARDPAIGRKPAFAWAWMRTYLGARGSALLRRIRNAA